MASDGFYWAESLFGLSVESVVLWNMTVCLRSVADASTALVCIVYLCLIFLIYTWSFGDVDMERCLFLFAQ